MNLKACRQQTWIVTLLCVGHCFCAVTLTQSSTNVDKGSSLNIIATFDEASLTWTYKEGTPLSTCSLALNTCFPSLEENMGFTVSSTTNTSTLSIASLNCSINTAVYVASTDSLLTDTVNIDVTTPVSSRVSTTVLTASKVPSQDLLVEVKCVYPRSTITANFTISRSGKPDDILFPDSIQTSTSSSGCECFEDTYVVKKTITALQYPNEVVQVQANIGQLSPLVIGDVNFTAGEVSKQSKAIEERSEKVFNTTAPGHAVGSAVHGSVCGTIQKLVELTFTYLRARRWHFSNQYTLCGTVVYGIQIVLVSAVSDIVTIAIVVGVLVYYYGQIECITIFYLFLLTAAFSIVGVLIYMLILVFFGDKDLIHIHFKKKKENIKLSAHGMKPIKDNNICIYFKVKAIYASITLHIIENMKKHQVQPRPEICQLKKVLTCKMLIDDKKDSNDSNHRNATHTEYQACYLKCENEKKTITVLDGNHKQIEQWTISADSFKIADIEISNINQDDSTKNESANCDSTKDDSKPNNSSKDDSKQNDSSKDDSTENEQDDNTKDASAKDASTKDASAKDASTKDASAKDASTKDNKKLETTDEWIFWFREGDTLCEIEEHKRKTTENLRCKQTVLLICVIILPIAWLVMIVLMLKNCIKSCKEKNTAKTDLEMIEKLNKDQKESSEQQDKKQKS